MSDALAMTLSDATWFRRISDDSHNLVLVYRLDPQGCIYVSPSCRALLGYEPEEFYVDPALWRRIVHPHDVAAIEHLMRVAEGRVEFRSFHKKGRMLWLESDVSVIRDDAGTVLAVHVVCRDISQRKDAELLVRDSEARYRALFDEHPQAMWVYDAETLKFLAVNAAALAFYGYSTDEFLAMTIVDIGPPEDRDRLRQMIRASADDALKPSAWRHQRKSGEIVDVFVTAQPIQFSGRPARLVMVQDLTAQRQAEEERAALQRALLQAQKLESVGRLAGGVAHDFNNLLTVISGYANLLLDEPETTSTIRERVSEIVLAAERARELTSKLLIFSRKHRDEPRIVAIDRFLEQELSQLRRLIGEDILVDPQLGAGGVMVRIDPAQLSQVLINLVVNARDAMPEGGTLTIATRRTALDRGRARAHGTGAGASFVGLSVRDTGCGMSPDVQAHLFEPFFSTKPVGHATGLGLATVYGLVQQAGGFLEVETGVNEGTTMTVFLPAAMEPRAPELPDPQTRPLGGDETILVVEDEAGVRLLTRTILERLGYTVAEAPGPEGALLLVAQGLRPNLIVTDVVMPNMHGPRLIAEIRRTASDFEVLYLSGFAETGVAGDLHADPRRFLAKPFDPEALARKVRDLLDLRRAHQ